MEDNLRQRVLLTTNLLLDAVDRLEGVTDSRNGTSTSAMPSSVVRSTPQPLNTTHAVCNPSTSLPTSTTSSMIHSPSSVNISQLTTQANTVTCSPSTSLSANANVHAELSHLFSWNSCLGKQSGSLGESRNPASRRRN